MCRPAALPVIKNMQLQPAIKTILNKRGISTAEDVVEFLSDKPRKTYDPYLLKGMDDAVELVLGAIETGAGICVYGDYDADGVTSVALMMDVLRTAGAECSYYIPSRFDEGYGLNSDALDRIKKAGAELVITVDCGCSSVAEVAHAHEIGLEIIVTDHHELKGELPDCVLIDPKQPGCGYPFKSLAGVGVAFKFAQAISAELGLPKQTVTRNLDLVGIGTVGDIVPLLDENRTLAKYGLRAINISERAGLRALIEKTGLKQGEINSRSVSFVIVPHINAAGRMGNATDAARLMLAGDEKRADALVDILISSNMKRRETQETIYRDCIGHIGENGADGGFLLVELEDAHEGITGIVCGMLKETYKVPSIIVTSVDEVTCKGTGRSTDNIDIFRLLSKRNDLFVRFGGHAAACGFTILREDVPKLRDFLEQEIGTMKSENPSLFETPVEADVRLEPSDVSFEFVGQLRALEPFGKCNELPLVEISMKPGDVRRMGSEGQYLSFTGELADGTGVRCVDFGEADRTERAIARADGAEMAFIGKLEEQTWNGRRYLQMTISAEGEVDG